MQSNKKLETLNVEPIQTEIQDEINIIALDEINQSPVVDTNPMPLDCIIPVDYTFADYETTRTNTFKTSIYF